MEEKKTIDLNEYKKTRNKKLYKTKLHKKNKSNLRNKKHKYKLFREKLDKILSKYGILIFASILGCTIVYSYIFL